MPELAAPPELAAGALAAPDEDAPADEAPPEAAPVGALELDVAPVAPVAPVAGALAAATLALGTVIGGAAELPAALEPPPPHPASTAARTGAVTSSVTGRCLESKV